MLSCRKKSSTVIDVRFEGLIVDIMPRICCTATGHPNLKKLGL